MKKTVWTFGLLSGAISIAMMLATLPAIAAVRHQVADLLGYTSMLLSALVVFFAVRSHRERAGGGRISFGRALGVGVLVTLIASACTAAAFEVVYFHLMPDFGDKFTACMIDRARTAGATPEKLEETARQARQLKELYDRPLANAALTFATSFPVGFAAAAISAAVLRRRGAA